MRAASFTSNVEKSLKKNEMAFAFCSSVRTSGLFGLSLPTPPVPEHHFPAGGLGWREPIRRAPGGGARAPVFVAPSLAGLLSTSMALQPLLPLQETTPLLMSIVFTVVSTVLAVLPPLDSA